MIKRKFYFKGSPVRYIILDNGELILNTDDVCEILKMTPKEREAGELSGPSISLETASFASFTDNPEFASWLHNRFLDFNEVCDVMPAGEEIWKF